MMTMNSPPIMKQEQERQEQQQQQRRRQRCQQKPRLTRPAETKTATTTTTTMTIGRIVLLVLTALTVATTTTTTTTTTTSNAVVSAFSVQHHQQRRHYHQHRRQCCCDVLMTKRRTLRPNLPPPPVSRLYSSNMPPDDPFVIVVDFNDDDDDDDNDENDDKGISIVEMMGLLQEGAEERASQLKFEAAAAEEDDEEDDDDEDDEEDDPYTRAAASEFQNTNNTNNSKDRSPAMTRAVGTSSNAADLDTTVMDWGGALSKLRERVDDVETGKSQDPAHVLFRQMSTPTPNQLIGQFVSSANPQVVQAMSGAVQSLLGGLSNPSMGVETIVKASGEKVGSLCFQLQMTGYMFRNAEYVLAIKDLMNLKGQKLTLEDYKAAFDKLDTDGSGFIELSEVKELFSEAYQGEKIPPFEIAAFLDFFDDNKDGKISWEEFEKGLGAALVTKNSTASKNASKLLEGHLNDLGDAGDDDGDEDVIDVNTNVSGRIQIEMADGKVVDVDAKEYMENLKEEARKLKEALRREHTTVSDSSSLSSPMNDPAGLLSNSGGMDIANYIAARQGDVKSLTEGISEEVVESMKLLVDFVLEGGDSGKAKKGLTDQQKAEMEMEIPGSALQQLALWQLVLGYRLREAEAKGDYIRLLEG